MADRDCRDIGISKLVGLPRVVRHSQTDVADPLNLFDSDFDEDSLELPLSRPETECTPSPYTRTRSRLTQSVGMQVTDMATQPRPSPYSDDLTIHNQIDSARNEIPLSLKWRGLSSSLNVQPRMLIKQIFLETTILAMKILLHKRFMMASQSHPQYDFSCSTCVAAARDILKIQQLVDDETHLEGRLYQTRWSIITTFIHDFLAPRVSCLYVQIHTQMNQVQNDGSSGDLVAEVADVGDIKELLRGNLTI